MRPAHGAFGAFAPELFFGQAGHDNGQLVWRQCVGVVQYRRDRQVFTAHRAIDNHLQALDGGEHIHRPPVAASAIVVKD